MMSTHPDIRDPKTRVERMREEVRAGLSRMPREIPPKYFYDARGSRLFEEITRLPEYYLTRTERALLEAWVPRWLDGGRPRSFVELGAGSAEKSRIVLDAMMVGGGSGLYVPIDVSASALEKVAQDLRAAYPGLRVAPSVSDIDRDLDLPDDLPRPALFAFLGSTIGNFDPPRAIQLLRRVRVRMEDRDRFLIGFDLKKDTARLEAAYNDAQGLTAEFNRNVLRVLNRELGANFDHDAFVHRAFYSREDGWIEMHLVSTRDQRVTIPEVGVVEFRKGGSIRTEISCKYDRELIEALCREAALRIEEWRTDPAGLFALVLATPTST